MYYIRSTDDKGAAFTKRNILTRFDEVVKLSSSLIMSALNVNALFKAFWYCVLLHICSWFSFCIFSFALSARSSQSSMVPAFGFKIQTNSGPYIPILYNYQKKKSFIPQYMPITTHESEQSEACRKIHCHIFRSLRSSTEVAQWLVSHDKCLKNERDMRHTSGSVARSMARQSRWLS